MFFSNNFVGLPSKTDIDSMTPRGTNMGAVANDRTPVKSELTALVCWAPKR